MSHRKLYKIKTKKQGYFIPSKNNLTEQSYFVHFIVSRFVKALPAIICYLNDATTFSYLLFPLSYQIRVQQVVEGPIKILQFVQYFPLMAPRDKSTEGQTFLATRS